MEGIRYYGAEVCALLLFAYLIYPRRRGSVYRGEVFYTFVLGWIMRIGMMLTALLLTHQLSYAIWGVHFLRVDLPAWLERLTMTVGVAGLLLGLSLNHWSFRTMGEWTLPPISRAPEGEGRLFTEGPFSFSRNPMYLSYWLLFTSVQLVTQSKLLLFSLPLFYILQWWADNEEIKQIELHPTAWHAYRMTVPRWFSLRLCVYALIDDWIDFKSL